jgi:hypothetical protein
MRTILSQLRYPQTRTQISCRTKQFAAAALLASVAGTAWVGQASAQDVAALVMPGYGPGIAGHVIEGPIPPVCKPFVPCVNPLANATVLRPLANATVLILDKAKKTTVGAAVTNASGQFLVTVPHGNYLVHVDTDGSLARCPEVSAAVVEPNFTPVQITCKTVIYNTN